MSISQGVQLFDRDLWAKKKKKVDFTQSNSRVKLFSDTRCAERSSLISVKVSPIYDNRRMIFFFLRVAQLSNKNNCTNNYCFNNELIIHYFITTEISQTNMCKAKLSRSINLRNVIDEISTRNQ